MRNSLVTACAALCTIVVCLASAARADDCPSAIGAKGSFVIERGPDSKTEVFYGDGAVVRTVLHYRDRTILETTLYGGLFELDRLDRGRRFVFKPKTDLAKLFPLKQQKIRAEFDLQQDDGKPATSSVNLTVIGTDTLYIGSCKYDIVKIQREETRANARIFSNVDYYAPALKLVVAKEYKENDGGTKLIKFDKIYSSAARP
jgi:hypothetical protein